jgi:anti-sigma B factor antagonist
MTMKGRVRTDAMGNITIHMEGGLDYQNSVPLQEELKQISKRNPTSQIVLDMFSLDFVGSSGIKFFVEMIRELNFDNDQIRVSNVKTEFARVFHLYDHTFSELIIDEFESDETFGMAQRFSGRRHTYEN